MFKFLAKGLLRDRSRSLFPILIVAGGVMITVLVCSWLNGFSAMMIKENARFETGHVKIITQAYNEIIDQRPFDLGLIDVNNTLTQLSIDYPNVKWQPRIYFGGLIDIPDQNGETRDQGEIIGMAVDLFSDNFETELLNLEKATTTGRIPQKQGEILISHDLADKLDINLNDDISLISSTMYGSMAIYNFNVVGFVKFGVDVMDRGAVIADLSDINIFLDMENSANEILGFLPRYNEQRTFEIAASFNNKYQILDDEFSPLMLPLKSQGDLDYMLSILDQRLELFIVIFILVMSLVLWNSGLMNGIRRYGEISVRLAIGESKAHILRSLIIESLLIGVIATIIGTIIGLTCSYYFQYYGINVSSLMKNADIVMSSTMRAQVTSTSYYIGFIPGVFASVTGAMISGIGIYRRNTAQLFKELET